MLIQFRSESSTTLAFGPNGAVTAGSRALRSLADVVQALVVVPRAHRGARGPAVCGRAASAGAPARGAPAAGGGNRYAGGSRAGAYPARVPARVALRGRGARLARARAETLITAAIAKSTAIAARLALPRALLASEARRAVRGRAARAIAAQHARATLRARGAKAAVGPAALGIVSGLAIAHPVAASVAKRTVAAARLALGGRRVARLSGRAIARRGAADRIAATLYRALGGRASAVGVATGVGATIVVAAGFYA
jgi:hypothetical protein